MQFFGAGISEFRIFGCVIFPLKTSFRYGQVSSGTDCSLYNKAMDSLITFLSHSAFSDYSPVVNGVMEIFCVLITKQKWIK